MKQHQLGQSDLVVHHIGLGCMSLGTEQKQAVSLVHEALEHGVTLLDTADLYDGGCNEELVGKALRGRRSSAIVATKVGNRRIEGQDGWVWDASKAYILDAVKQSMRRLQTDYIDLYQLHGGTLDDPMEETVEAFEQLKREGWIRAYGLSSMRPNVVAAYAEKGHFATVMVPYSMLDRRPEEQLLPCLQQHGIRAIVRGALGKGLLTTARAGAVVDDPKGFDASHVEETMRVLRAMPDREQPMTTLALQYVLAHPAVAAVIPGARTREQLLDNMAAGQAIPLSAEQYEWLQEHLPVQQYEQHRIGSTNPGKTS